MTLYVLYESASGYGLFSADGIDEIGQNTEAVRSSVADLNRFGKVVKLAAFSPFESALDALNQCNAISEGKNHQRLNWNYKDGVFQIVSAASLFFGMLGFFFSAWF